MAGFTIGDWVAVLDEAVSGRGYDDRKCYDAEYQKYGSGATEVYIPPKG